MRGRRLGSWPASTATAALALAVLLAGCGGSALAGEVGSGRLVTESRSPGPFTELRVGTSVEADVTVGPAAEVVVTADDNLLDNVATTTDGTVLEVRITGGVLRSTRMHVRITVPALVAIEATNSASVSVTGVSADELRVVASTSGRVRADGRAVALAVEGSNSADIDLAGVAAARATVQLGTSARATVAATDEVRGSVTTSAVLVLVEAPGTVDVETSTSGRIEQR